MSRPRSRFGALYQGRYILFEPMPAAFLGKGFHHGPQNDTDLSTHQAQHAQKDYILETQKDHTFHNHSHNCILQFEKGAYNLETQTSG